MNREIICFDAVAPARERGLKFVEICDFDEKTGVAPARERGLKYRKLIYPLLPLGRSREGAWIEIAVSALTLAVSACRSREGAWIEIDSKESYRYRLWSLPRGSVD